MTSEQLLEATSRGRGKESETPRLISTHDQHHRRCEFIQSLLYMIVNCSVKVKEVVRIITFQHERLFADYLQGLQNLRARSTSNLESKLIKNLANSIPGVRLMFVYFVLCCIITSHTYQQATLFHYRSFTRMPSPSYVQSVQRPRSNSLRTSNHLILSTFSQSRIQRRSAHMMGFKFGAATYRTSGGDNTEKNILFFFFSFIPFFNILVLM